MPISLSAKKSLRKSLKNRKENVYAKSKLKKIVKDFLTKPSAEGLKAVYSALDKVGKKRIYRCQIKVGIRRKSQSEKTRYESNYQEKLKENVIAMTLIWGIHGKIKLYFIS